MDFRTFYTSMPVADRESFAKAADTTRGYCNQIAYGGKEIELGMADVFVTISGAKLTLDELPLTDRARRQRATRGMNFGATVGPGATRQEVADAT